MIIKSKIQRIIFFLIITCLSMTCTVSAHSGHFDNNVSNCHFRDYSLGSNIGPEASDIPLSISADDISEDESTYLDGWQVIDGNTYYYDYGKPAKGCFEIDDVYYGFDKNGILTSGWIKIANHKWYTNKNGIIQTGIKTIDGNKYYFTKDDDYTKDGYCTYGMMCDCGIYKNYIISYTGKLYRIPNKESDKNCKKVAKLIAKCCGKNSKRMSDIEKIDRAAHIVGSFSNKCRYTMKGKYYNKAYGVFYKKECSCAGSTRALGLILSKMGYKWKHANESKMAHQWCKLRIKGRNIWADGMAGMAGYGGNPFASGNYISSIGL